MDGQTLPKTALGNAAVANPYGWLRNASFDLTLIVGVAAIALLSGAIVLARPQLFPVILFIDLWLLGYQHVVSTFTRLTFDTESFRQHRFLVLGLPVIVLAAVLAGAWVAGAWILSTTYLYWQWFHYTRQSYGIERAYRRKVSGQVAGNADLTRWALYLVPLWGILYRSYQSPETFLGIELKVLPVAGPVVFVAGLAALAALVAWGGQVVVALVRGERLQAHTLYVACHMVIFVVGYRLIENINFGWLVVNVWHNAQYILFVWMFNNRRFRQGLDPKARWLSFLSQRRNWPLYFLVCLVLSTVVYFGLERFLSVIQSYSTLPLILIAYQAINFHHYLVDGMIWKLRKKPLQQTLGIDAQAG